MVRTHPSWPPRGRSTPPPDLARLLEQATGHEPVFDSVEDLFDRQKIEAAVGRKVQALRRRMADLWPQLTSETRGIIKCIAREEQAEREQIAAEWLVQRMLFLEIGRHFDLKLVERFSRSRPDCFLVLTERASLITGGSLKARGERAVEYIRIPSRVRSWQHDVSLRGPVKRLRCGRRARLPGLRTSPVQFILVVPAERSIELDRIAKITSVSMSSTFIGERLPTSK